jgi:hypothetical protein
MPAFQDVLDLRTAVVEAVKSPSIADVFPRLLSLAETQINRTARHRKQIVKATLSFVNGEVLMPTGFLDFVEAPKDIDYRTDADGTKLIILGFTGDREVAYYARIPALVGLSGTNWALDEYPDVYLYGVAEQAAKHLRETEAVAAFAPMFRSALMAMNHESNRTRYSGQLVRVQGCTP